MKKQILSFFAFLAITTSCSENNLVKPEEKVAISKTQDLSPPSQVKKISVLTSSDLEFQNSKKFLQSYLKMDEKNDDFVSAHYLYEDGGESLVFGYLSDNRNIFAQLQFSDPSEPDKMLQIIWTDLNNDNILTKNELSILDITDPSNPVTVDALDWGQCMKNAIDRLYNDWTNDPIGTSACWATGTHCAVGAALACALKSL